MSFLLQDTFDLILLLGIGFPAGIIASAWIAYLLNFLFPLSLGFGIINILILLLSSLPFHHRRDHKFTHKFPWWAVLGGIILPGLFLLWFLYFGLFYQENLTRGAGFGDLPFHLNLIASFAYGCNSQRKSLFDLVTPFFAKEPLAYPIMSNFYSAVLLRSFSITWHSSIIIPSVIFEFSLFSVLAGIVSKFSHGYGPCLIAPWLFLFTGGLGFVNFVRFRDVRNAFYTDFVHSWGHSQSGSWFQTIIHVLLPQRASLHSLPIAHSIILILMHVGDSGRLRAHAFAAVGVLVALLPQVQPHSIVACGEWGFVFAVVSLFPLSDRKTHFVIMNYGIVAGIAICFGLPQMTPYFSRTKHGFWRISAIWREEHADSLLQMWWRSLGVFFMLATFHGPSMMNLQQLRYYLPSFAVWLLGNYLIYQPWQLDNTKIFNAAWIPMALSSASFYLACLWKRNVFGKLLAVVLLFFACLSGILATRMAYRETYPLWSHADHPHELAVFVRENSHPKAIWLLDDWHAHPVTSLAGRQSVLGYGGWTSSHGLGETSRRSMIRQLASDPDVVKEADEFGVQFVCLRKGAPAAIRFPVRANSTKWKVIYDTTAYRIYERTKSDIV